jgi:hypothetical protein
MKQVHFIAFPSGEKKLCFSRAHTIRVLRYESWTRDESREAVGLSADVYPYRWVKARPRRSPEMSVVLVTVEVSSVTLSLLRSWWSSNTTDLEGVIPNRRIGC